VIRVRDLSVVLGGRRILAGVSLSVAPGESVALAGPNGAGKTTLLRAVLGLVRYGGGIRVGGMDLAADPVRAKSLLGYMPQVPAFCEETARASLGFVAALRGVPKRRTGPLLERVGLSAHADRPVRSFSTGMRQRLSLAAALVGDPRVLVLDEPTASLDLRGQVDFVRLLHGLQEEGRTLLLCSHRAEEVRALAHRLVVLDEGRVVASGPADEVAAQVWGAGESLPLPTADLLL
jgi:Cu-processing system ATP-binding protein